MLRPMVGRRAPTNATAAVAICGLLLACSLTPQTSPPSSTVVGRDWTLTGPLPESAGAVLAGIASSSDVVVVVGLLKTGNATNAAVWESQDGTTWTRDPDAAGFENHGLLAVALGSGRFVALGATCGSVECEGQAYWTSTDGISWSFAGDVGGVCCLMNAIAAGGPGFVAVGADQSTGFPQTPADGAVSLSSSGKRWRVIQGEPAFKAVTFGSVVAGGPGLVASGFNGKPGVWTSTDGQSWEESASDFGTGEIQAVAAGGPGFVAVGRDGQSAMSWTSTDGVTWARASTTLGPGVMHSIIAIGGRVVAGGNAGGAAAVWSSDDGMHWIEDTGPAASAADINRMAAFGTALIAIGSGPTGEPLVLIGR